MLKSLIKLMRPKHYLKNGLVFVPLVFSGRLLDESNLAHVFFAAVAFSLVASIIYIINDSLDVKKDQKHPIKKHRPIASGDVKIWQAYILVCILLLAVLIIGTYLQISLMSIGLLAGYLLINILYSAGLKNIPIIDVAILASGFVIRVLFGASVLNIDVSSWLYLTVLTGAYSTQV